MAPRDAKLEPKGPQKYEKDTKMYPRVQTCKQKCNNEATGYVPCQKSTTRPPKVVLRRWVKPKGAEKHVQTTRGRVLAEGDVDPAAGSRDEPTRLHVEAPVAERKQGIEVQVTRALFLYTINWVPPLPPDFSGLLKRGARGTPKDVKK